MINLYSLILMLRLDVKTQITALSFNRKKFPIQHKKEKKRKENV
jgi:hypothetical protein